VRFLSFFLSLAVLVIAQDRPATSFATEEWSRPFAPFRIAGNLYYVGTWDLASYLIVTPAGNIVINTGLADSVPQILSNIETLGFKPADTKIITCTHAHWDHVAGMAKLKSATGARVVATERDAELLESGGKTDFRFGKDSGAWFDPVKVDTRVKNGDKISLGGTELTVHLHPGHTKGAASFTFTVKDEQRSWRILLVNMGSVNPGVTLAKNAAYPNIAEDYAATFRDQKAMTFDIWVASHAGQYNLHQKHKPGDPYAPQKFADAESYQTSVTRLQRAFESQLARERAAQ